MRIEAAGELERGVELGRRLDEREPDGRALAIRLDDQRKAEPLRHDVRRHGRHQPVRRRHAGREEQPLRDVLVPAERAAELAASPYTGCRPRSSSACTVPSSPLPPCIARNTRSTSARSGADTTVGRLATALLVGRPAIDLAGEQPLLVGRREPAAAGVVGDDLVPAAAQSADDLRSARDRHVALHAIATEQHSDLQRGTSCRCRKPANCTRTFRPYSRRAARSRGYILSTDESIQRRGTCAAIQRLTLVALLAGAIVCGCESGSSEGPAADLVHAGARACRHGFRRALRTARRRRPLPQRSLQPDGDAARGAREDHEPARRGAEHARRLLDDGRHQRAVQRATRSGLADSRGTRYRWRRAPRRSSC